jgi:hypothetical protein
MADELAGKPLDRALLELVCELAAGGVIADVGCGHLGPAERAAAYREFARTLRPGGCALIAFHTSDPDTRTGEVTSLTRWWGHEVELTFRFLDPSAELEALAAAGLVLQARLDRLPYNGSEHPSRRSYLLLRRP